MAPAASALPISETTIKTECRAAGGTYASEVRGRFRFSTCSHTDYSGVDYTDHYANGDYYSTTSP